MANAKSPAEQRMDALLKSSAKQVLAEFFRDRLLEKQSAYTRCTTATFEAHKGRCLELEDLIKLTTES